MAAASGLLLFVGRQARALEKTNESVGRTSELGGKFFDAAGDVVGDLRMPVKQVGRLIGETAGLGGDVVGGVRSVLRAPKAVVTFGGRAATGGARAFGRGARTSLRFTGRAARGTGRAAVKVVTTPARAAKSAFRALGRIF